MNWEAFQHYKTGVTDLDSQHWGLFQVLRILKTPLQNQQLIDFADRLFLMWNEHLAHEELLMCKIDYPFAKAHLDAHVDLSSMFMQFKQKVQTDPMCNYKWLTEELELTLKNHIDTIDRQYGDWIDKQRITNI